MLFAPAQDAFKQIDPFFNGLESLFPKLLLGGIQANGCQQKGRIFTWKEIDQGLRKTGPRRPDCCNNEGRA